MGRRSSSEARGTTQEVVDPPSRAQDEGSGCRHDHLVGFYETEAFLVDTVCSFLTPTLHGGDAAIVVATAVHRRLFDAALVTAGIDVGAAIDDGRYLPFDAETVLARFMVDSRPDPTRFHATLGPLLAGAREGGRRVHVYGEMVAVLLEGGDGASALALEDLWNDLAEIHSFVLLCAYPMRAFEDEATTAVFTRICEQHGTVIPSEGYSLVLDPLDRLRAIAQLQQQVAVLGPEVDRLRAQVRDQQGHERDRSGGLRDQEGVERDEAGVQRDEAGVQRDEAGVQRDQVADQRDQAAEHRDQAAERRDEASERSEASAGHGIAADPLDRLSMARREAASDRRRASQDRRAAARERMEAESDRGTALADRGAGAIERTHAELDRDTAQSDRGASARERADSSRDDLTGAYHRGAGFVELEREIARARRGQQPLVLAFIDVDGLKRVNDSFGHAAGDRLLVEVVRSVRSVLRSYDLVIRYGGDEFVCVISGLSLAAATERLALVNHALAQAPEHGSVTVGLADLQPVDSIEDLIGRADAALYHQRLRTRAIVPLSEPLLR